MAGPDSAVGRPAPLSGIKLLGALLVPWLFLALFGVLYWRFILPHLTGGHIIGTCFGLFVGLVFCSFTVAAVTFSRDVIAGRYP